MRICITVSKEQIDFLKRLSMVMGISQGAIVRIALGEYFAQYTINDKKQVKKK